MTPTEKLCILIARRCPKVMFQTLRGLIEFEISENVCVVNPEGKLADGRVKLIQSCDVVPFKSK